MPREISLLPKNEGLDSVDTQYLQWLRGVLMQIAKRGKKPRILKPSGCCCDGDH